MRCARSKWRVGALVASAGGAFAIALLLTLADRTAAAAPLSRGTPPPARLVRIAVDVWGTRPSSPAAPGGARAVLAGAPEAAVTSAAPGGARLRLGRLEVREPVTTAGIVVH